MVNKVIKDGKVAVLVSGGFGAGFSTWLDLDGVCSTSDLVFNPTLIEMVEAGRHAEITEEFLRNLFNIPKETHMYLGGVDSLGVEWVPTNKRFYIEEYDGSETIVMEDEIKWLIAEEPQIGDIYYGFPSSKLTRLNIPALKVPTTSPEVIWQQQE